MASPDEGQSKILDTGLRECLDPEHLVGLVLEVHRNLESMGCDSDLMTEGDRIEVYPPGHWDAQALSWDEIVAMPTNPHQFYYLEADFLISSVLDERMRVLELGCGTGGSTAVHVEEVARLVATDISRSMLRQAANRFQIGPYVNLAAIDASTLPFRPNTFDAVFSRGVLLSYVGDARRALAEVYRVLRPGGWIAMDAMNRVRAWEPSISRGFWMIGGAPVYVEVTLRGGRQIQKIYTLSTSSPYAGKARRMETCKREPKDLQHYVEKVEQYEARQFEPHELHSLLEEIGFHDVTIRPLGHLANSLAFEDGELKEFVREHRQTLVRLFLELSEHLKLETAWHLFVTAKRPS